MKQYPVRVFILVVATAGTAAAQEPKASDIAVPEIVIDSGETSAVAAADDALDLANIVRSAAKGLTTVQEAPAIVTVITDDEIRDRQFQDF